MNKRISILDTDIIDHNGQQPAGSTPTLGAIDLLVTFQLEGQDTPSSVVFQVANTADVGGVSIDLEPYLESWEGVENVTRDQADAHDALATLGEAIKEKADVNRRYRAYLDDHYNTRALDQAYPAQGFIDANSLPDDAISHRAS